MKNHPTENVSNIYNLNGRVPIMKAIPFGLSRGKNVAGRKKKAFSGCPECIFE